MDSFSSNKSKTLMAWFASALIMPQFSPPGQHAFLQDMERLWYPLLVRAVIGMRHGRAPMPQWFNGMCWAADIECALAHRLGTPNADTGYGRSLGQRHSIADLYPFYAPARFALDSSALANKWVERARAGFWVGRDSAFVMTGKTGSAIFWDGRIHRTVVDNYRVNESSFLDLTAPGNALLPAFPHDEHPVPACIVDPTQKGGKAPRSPQNCASDVRAATSDSRGIDSASQSWPEIPSDSTESISKVVNRDVEGSDLDTDVNANNVRPKRDRTSTTHFQPGVNFQPGEGGGLKRALTAPVISTADASHRERVIVPSTLWPNESCEENDGRGWTAEVIARNKRQVKLRFLERATDGKPWTNVYLSPDVLLPWCASIDVNFVVPSQSGIDTCALCNTPLSDLACECEGCHAIWHIHPPVSAPFDGMVTATIEDTRHAMTPSMDIIVNLFSGSYYNENGLSSILRNEKNIGVLSVDADEECGGGHLADLTANAVFNIMDLLVTCRRVAGFVVAQPCSSGSVVRLEAGDGGSSFPSPVRTQEEKGGIADLPRTYKKEVHKSELLSFRVTYLLKRVHEQGGWFFAECPASRGTTTRAASFDPAFATHASVMDGPWWDDLERATGARRVTSAMCGFKDYYPQKLEDFMISSRLLPQLERRLESLACVHPVGTHAQRLPTGDAATLKGSQKWLHSLCVILADAFAQDTPTGGPSHLLGVDDAADWAMNGLMWRDAQYALSLDRNASSLLGGKFGAFDRDSMAMAIIDGLDDRTARMPKPSDIDPCLEPCCYVLTGTVDGLLVNHMHVEIFEAPSGECYVVTASVDGKIEPFDDAPQTDNELKNHRDRVGWEAEDSREIDGLMADIRCLEEMLESDLIIQPRKIWKAKFVRKYKMDNISGKQLRRSRIVCVGVQQLEGHEFTRKDAPTPMWATTLLSIGMGTVIDAIDFQFDMTQYFQRTDCKVPDGDGFLVLLPPPRFQRHEMVNGKRVRVLWKCAKWLQGAKGAGYEARKSFIELVTKNDILAFAVDKTDPSLFMHHSSAGQIQFTLHVDDGCGGWATHQSLIDKLKLVLGSRYPGFKFGAWKEQLGFEVTRDRSAGTTTLTAHKQIAKLERLVEGECRYTPTMPYQRSINDIAPVAVPDVGSPEHAVFTRRVSWCRSAIGALHHVSKVRCDITTSLNLYSRYAHVPEPAMEKGLKHMIFFLLHTIKHQRWHHVRRRARALARLARLERAAPERLRARSREEDAPVLRRPRRRALSRSQHQRHHPRVRRCRLQRSLLPSTLTSQDRSRLGSVHRLCRLRSGDAIPRHPHLHGRQPTCLHAHLLGQSLDSSHLRIVGVAEAIAIPRASHQLHARASRERGGVVLSVQGQGQDQPCRHLHEVRLAHAFLHGASLLHGRKANRHRLLKRRCLPQGLPNMGA